MNRLCIISLTCLMAVPALAQQADLPLDGNELTVALVQGKPVRVATTAYNVVTSYRSGDAAYWKAAGLKDGQDGSGAWVKAVINPGLFYQSGVTDPRAPLMMVRIKDKFYYRWSEYLPTPEKRYESEAYWLGIVEARRRSLPHARFTMLTLGKDLPCTPYGCIVEVTYP